MTKKTTKKTEKKCFNLCKNCFHFNPSNFEKNELTKTAGICEKKSMIKFKNNSCNQFESRQKVDAIFSDKPYPFINNIAPGQQLELF